MRCPACQTVSPPNSRFCPACGRTLAPASADTGADTGADAPASVTIGARAAERARAPDHQAPRSGAGVSKRAPWVMLAVAAGVIFFGAGGVLVARGMLGPRFPGLMLAPGASATPSAAAATPTARATTASQATSTAMTATNGAPSATPTRPTRAATPAATPTPPATATPAATAAPPPATVAPATGSYYVDASRLGVLTANLHAQPSKDAPVLAVIPNGTRVMALQQPVAGPDSTAWLRVTYSTHRGYMLAAVLRPHRPAALITLYVDGTAQGLAAVKLRLSPSTAAPISLRVPYGERVRAAPPALRDSNGRRWYRVFFQQTTGYMPAADLRRRPPAALLTLYVGAAGQSLAGTPLYSRPSTRAATLLVAPNREQVLAMIPPLRGRDGEYWYRVFYHTTLGYMSAASLSIHQPAPLATYYVDASHDGYDAAVMRSRPDVTARQLLLTPNGAPVQVMPPAIQGTDGKSWYSASYHGASGYVHASYLHPTFQQPAPQLYAYGGSYGYTGALLRQQPSIAAPIVGGVDNGGHLYLIDPQAVPGDNGEDWYHVASNGTSGYARAKLLSTQKQQPTPSLYVNAAADGYTGVNLRDAPSPDANPVIGADNGARVYLLGPAMTGNDGNTWYSVAYADKVGYVPAKWLSPQPPS